MTRILVKLTLTVPIQMLFYAIADAMNTTQTSFTLGAVGAITVILVCFGVDKLWQANS